MVDQKLLDAIKKYLDQGVNADSVKQALMQSGWSEKDVNSALEKITGQKIAEEKKLEGAKPSESKRRLFFIVGGVIAILILAASAYIFLFQVGFSEDIPDDFVPLGELNNFMKERMTGYNPLALKATSPLKEAIQNGKVNLIMTDELGTRIIDVVGVVVENSQIVSTSLKVKDPSFDVKFTEKAFDSMITSTNTRLTFLEYYASGKVKIKAYGKGNEGELSLLDGFVAYFFVF